MLKPVKDQARVFAHGEIDISTVHHLLELIEACDNTLVTLDCKGIEFIDSTGIGLLLRKKMEMYETGRDLVFVEIPKHVSDVFEEMGIFQILEEFKGM
ncbi:MAG TPA: STAS domain-containing protein [Bacilli bacterium]|nr:STAS domain-containing protein [Bacilli bacterium]